MIAKKELEQIRGVVKEEIDGALENFAVIVNKGFEQTASKTELHEFKNEFIGFKDEFIEFKGETKEGFRTMNNRIDHQDAELSSISTNLQDYNQNKVQRFEFEDLESRVKYTELKLSIESGK